MKAGFNLQDLEGVGPTTEKKLNNAGIFTPFDIVVRGTKEFSRVSGLSIETAEKHMDGVKKLLVESGEVIIVNDIDTLRLLREKQIKTPLKVDDLDEMLRGGVETQSLYEIYGAEGNGKTQFSFTVAAEALNAGYGVLFIDCEGTFDEERLSEIMTARGHDKYDDKKIGYHLWTDPIELMSGMRGMVNELIEKDVRYIIIDGLVGIMRLAYEGRGELADRQNELETILKYLKTISLVFNIGVIITNQVVANPDGFGAKEKPIGGHVLGHYVKYIISITKGMKNNRVAHLIKSNKSASGDYAFFLNEEGVSQYETLSQKKKSGVKLTAHDEVIIADGVLEEIEDSILVGYNPPKGKIKVF